MKEVKSPKKPLVYYYGIVILVLFLFNLFVSPVLHGTPGERSGLWNIHGHDR